MFAVIPEVLADGCTGEGRKILHGAASLAVAATTMLNPSRGSLQAS